MDPTNYAPLHDVLLMHGAQDEVFPVRLHQLTRDKLIDHGTATIYTYLIADFDHKFYLLTPQLQHYCLGYYCSEAYFNGWTPDHPDPDPVGVSRVLSNIRAFFFKVAYDDLADFGDPSAITTITVSGSAIKTYLTKIQFETSNHFDEARHGFSGTNFFHIYPGLVNGEPSPDDIPDMSESPSCPSGYTCYQRATYYTAGGQPAYYGSYGQVGYVETNYNGTGIDLYWFLTADVVSAGTSGDTVYDFLPDIRCRNYNAWNCNCLSFEEEEFYLEEALMAGW